MRGEGTILQDGCLDLGLRIVSDSARSFHFFSSTLTKLGYYLPPSVIPPWSSIQRRNSSGHWYFAEQVSISGHACGEKRVEAEVLGNWASASWLRGLGSSELPKVNIGMNMDVVEEGLR